MGELARDVYGSEALSHLHDALATQSILWVEIEAHFLLPGLSDALLAYAHVFRGLCILSSFAHCSLLPTSWLT